MSEIGKWSSCLNLHLQIFSCYFLSILLRRGREKMAVWVTGSWPWSVHYISNLRRRGNTLHVVHSGCFVFNRKKFVAVWREKKYLQRLWSLRSVSARTSKCWLMKCKTNPGMFPLILLLTITFPAWHPSSWFAVCHHGSRPSLITDESCTLVQLQGIQVGWSLLTSSPHPLSSSSATSGHLAGLVAPPPLAQWEVLCLILKPSKPSHSSHPCTWLSSNPESYSMECPHKSLLKAENELPFPQSLKRFSILLHVLAALWMVHPGIPVSLAVVTTQATWYNFSPGVLHLCYNWL